MSTLRVNTLQDQAGTGQPDIDGLCKAWVNFNGTGTVAIRASYNVSSITDNGTGNYTVNFTTPMVDSNYCVQGTMGNSSAGANAIIPTNNGAVLPATTSIYVGFYVYGAASDPTYAYISIFR